MSGTMWSDDLMTCDYSDHVDCGDRPYPDGSTSPHPPTTTERSTTTERTTTMEKTTTTEKETSTSSTGGPESSTTKTPETTTSSHSGGTFHSIKVYFIHFHNIYSKLKVLMSFQVRFWGCTFFSRMIQRTGKRDDHHDAIM